jgi:hypothetical protein
MPGFQPISFFADLIEFGLGVAGLSMTMSRRPRPPGQTVQTGQTQVEPGPRP